MSSDQRTASSIFALVLGMVADATGQQVYGGLTALAVAVVVCSGAGPLMRELVDVSRRRDASGARVVRLRVAAEGLAVIALMLMVTSGGRPSASALVLLAGSVAATGLADSPLPLRRWVSSVTGKVETRPTTAEAA